MQPHTSPSPDRCPPSTPPNWFIGFAIQSESLAAIARQAPDGLQPVHPDDLHLTVAFLGSCGETTARQAWQNIIAAPPPARSESTLRVEPIGLASCAKYYVASFAKADATAAFMLHVRRQNHAQFGIEDNFEPFPHITLARRGNSPLSVREAAARWFRESDIEGLRVHLNTLALYTWADDLEADQPNTNDQANDQATAQTPDYRIVDQLQLPANQ